MDVLTWNLKHGRAVPSAHRNLYEEFARALGSWSWDVALLQEVPPWWPAAIGHRLEVSHASVLTSRNALLPLRRWVAERDPDLIRSNGGGCNAILVRDRPIEAHRTRRLGRFPERRWVHAVRLRELWVANVHCQASPAQARLAGSVARAWAVGMPSVLGGDFNLRALSLEHYVRAGESGVDYVFASGLTPSGTARILERGHLSDHAPLLVTL